MELRIKFLIDVLLVVLMNYEEIRSWINSEVIKLCPNCKDNCCSTNKHPIEVDVNSLMLFPKNIQRVPYENIYIDTRESYEAGEKSIPLFDLQGNPIPKPAFVEVPKDNWIMHIDGNCPAYNRGKCNFFFYEQRPNVCKEYPVSIGNEKIIVRSSCKPAVRSGLAEKIREQFPEFDIDVRL